MTPKTPPPAPEVIYRPVKAGDLIDGFIIAVDDAGEGYLVKAPEFLHPDFFCQGPRLARIPIMGMTCEPGVYKVECELVVEKGYVHGKHQPWADELEWYVTGYNDYTELIE